MRHAVGTGSQSRNKKGTSQFLAEDTVTLFALNSDSANAEAWHTIQFFLNYWIWLRDEEGVLVSGDFMSEGLEPLY
jgi:hypothetical protein